MRLEIEEKIQEICSPILSEYEATIPDLVALCRYKLGDPKIDREDVHTAIRRMRPSGRFRYVPYYDKWRPSKGNAKSRKEFLKTIPKIVRRILLYEIISYLRKEEYWKRHHVYQAYADEMDVGLY